MVAMVTGGEGKKTKTKTKCKRINLVEKLFEFHPGLFCIQPQTHTLGVYHDLSVRQVGQSSFLLFAEEAADGRLDAFLLGLLVQGVLAAGDAAEGAGVRLQGGHDAAQDKPSGSFNMRKLQMQRKKYIFQKK